MIIHKGYKTELSPNNKQITLFKKNCGCARFAFNWALNKKKLAFDKKEKIPNYIELSRELNKLKQNEFFWMYEASKCSPQYALNNCDNAFKNFFRNCKKKVKGKKGFPKFKSKHFGVGNFRLMGHIHIFDGYIQLPKIGKIKLKEKNYLPQDKKILSATVSEKAGKWFVSLQVQEDISLPNKNEAVVGVDLGIKTLAYCSDGKTFDNPKALRSNLKKLQKLGKRLSRKTKGGQNRQKAKIKLARLHQKIANIRKNCLHKITTYLTKTKSKVVIEDLNISGMLKNRRLSRAISDLGLYELRRQLEYKGKWYDCEIATSDRFYPSSKRCSNCGNIKSDLKLDERMYICDKCNMNIDRDFNASLNLEQYCTVSSTGNNAFGDESSGSREILSETIVNELGIKQKI